MKRFESIPTAGYDHRKNRRKKIYFSNSLWHATQRETLGIAARRSGGISLPQSLQQTSSAQVHWFFFGEDWESELISPQPGHRTVL